MFVLSEIFFLKNFNAHFSSVYHDSSFNSCLIAPQLGNFYAIVGKQNFPNWVAKITQIELTLYQYNKV